MFSWAMGFPSEDSFVNLTESQLIDELGSEYESLFIIVDKTHVPYEIEPDYSDHFSADELADGVTVKIMKWTRRRKVVQVWLRNSDDVWTSFSSVQYDERSVSF